MTDAMQVLETSFPLLEMTAVDTNTATQSNLQTTSILGNFPTSDRTHIPSSRLSAEPMCCGFVFSADMHASCPVRSFVLSQKGFEQSIEQLTDLQPLSPSQTR